MTPAFIAALLISLILPDEGGDPTMPSFQVQKAPANAALTLHLIHAKDGTLGSAMFAKVDRSGDTLTLSPAFPLSRGQHYRALLKLSDGSEIVRDYELEPSSGAAPVVERVLPTADVLPANLLKFYLEFSEPMREGVDLFDQIHLEDATGKRVHDPWRRQELWNPERDRLTLWIHPGRVKRGVNLRETLGPVLLPDQEYTLVLEGSIRAANGKALGKEHRHSFRTGLEDYERPLPQTWTLTPPKAGASEPLLVQSPEPLDRALLDRHVSLWQDDQELETNCEIQPGDTAWSFTPLRPWKPGTYELRITPYLEDLAGNTPLRVFDTDLDAPEPEPAKMELEFVIP